MSLFADLWGILTPKQRRGILTMQIVSMAMAFSTVGGIAAIAPFFSVLGQPQLIDHNALLQWAYLHGGFSSKRSFVVALGIGFVAVMLIANLINVLGSLAMSRLALRIGNELQSTLFGEYLARPYAFHTRASGTMLSNNILHETARVTNGILRNAFLLVTNLVTALFIVLSILLLNPVIALGMIAGLAGGYALIYLVLRNKLLQLGQTQSRSAIEQAQILNESFGAIKEIIVLQAQNFFRGRFERASKSFSLAAAHSQVVAQNPRYLMECVAAVGLVGLALVLGGREDGVGPWLGQLTFLAFAAYRLLPMLQQVFAATVNIRANRAGLALIAPDLRRTRSALHTAVPANFPADHAWQARPQQEIRLEEVSFRYASDQPWALKRVSLRIPARAAVGIVGVNGSGKTTLVDVIVGLLAPSEGRVEVDGSELDETNRAAWQSRIAYVPQNMFLLDSSIAQNVALGVPAADIDRKRLAEAVRLAQLDDLIKTLPSGYDHRLGERGIQLSGGQRQRIGIARALYQAATVLVFDEATNALDGLTEQELMSTLGGLRGRYTTILIAHRMTTVRSCDIIFELENGKITGSGTYDGLLKTSAVFRRMTGVR
ncbi:MAG TPA: ABC transporter ATP-binding protein [Steroidobacteraceae bacterium]|jgi:HlyD family secretion protein|nr:ABC transporter ATP-binding protein [Steroidobacteraceae bacterium]